MREIEFRAWLKKEKEMYKVVDMDFELNWIQVLDEINAPFRKQNGFQNRATIELDNIELMQYTGKKDKNGTKIFESDIVLVDEYEQEIAIIKWDEECGNFYFELDNLYLTFDEYYANELEVVGNIYQNPELLGDGDDIKE